MLTIGDSNGAAADGWPVWLRQLVNVDVFINNSQSGRTLGFDNPNSDSNGLANIDKYINEAIQQAGEGMDDVIVMLGTNDCKDCFDGRFGEIEGNLRKLIEKIRKHDNAGKWSPRITVVAPPPYGPDEKMLEKYQGGARRARLLREIYEKVCRELYVRFVDGYGLLEGDWDEISPDGVHMNTIGQKRLAEVIAKVLG